MRWPVWTRPGRVDNGFAGQQDMLGHPGALTSYRMFLANGQQVPQYDACCPGCGQFVAALVDDEWPLVGTDTSMSTVGRKRMTWACCGWSGRLRNGVWRFSVWGLPHYLAFKTS